MIIIIIIIIITRSPLSAASTESPNPPNSCTARRYNNNDRRLAADPFVKTCASACRFVCVRALQHGGGDRRKLRRRWFLIDGVLLRGRRYDVRGGLMGKRRRPSCAVLVPRELKNNRRRRRVSSVSSAPR